MAYSLDTKPEIVIAPSIDEGSSIGLLLTLTYAEAVIGSGYVNETEPAVIAYTNDTRPSVVGYNNDTKPA